MTARQHSESSGNGPPAPSPAQLMRRLQELSAELEQVHAQLEHADRLAALGTLAATIAHEFNNLLTPSMNWAHLAIRSIESGEPDLELARKALAKCHAAGQKAGRICEAILNFSRVPGEGESAGAECDVDAVVEEALAACARDPERDGITLRRTIPAGLRAAIDPLQLEHVLVNLLINARQAMSGRRRGTITLTAALEHLAAGPRVRIEITDTGCGIDAADLPRIFDSFYTTRRSGAPAGRGTGLGLSLCRQIVQRHRGQITAHSTPGQGTTFRVHLPAAGSVQGTSGLAA